MSHTQPSPPPIVGQTPSHVHVHARASIHPPLIASPSDWIDQSPTLLLNPPHPIPNPISATAHTDHQRCIAAAASTRSFSTNGTTAHPTLKRRHSVSGNKGNNTSSNGNAAKKAKPSNPSASSSSDAAPSQPDHQSSTSHHYYAPFFGLLKRADKTTTQKPDSSSNGRVAMDTSASNAPSPNAPDASPTPSSSPSASPSPTPTTSTSAGLPFAPLPPRLSKRQQRALRHDYTHFITSMQSQATNVVSTTLPKRILQLQKLADQMRKEIENESRRKRGEVSAVTNGGGSSNSLPQSSPLLTHFPPQIVDAVQSCDATNGGSIQPGEVAPFQSPHLPLNPEASLSSHTPVIRSSLPLPASTTVTPRGWSWMQPTKSTPSNVWLRRWVKVLYEELQDQASLFSLVRTALQLQLPEAEESNTSQVEICDEILTNIRTKEDWGTGLRARLLGYSMQRAKHDDRA